MTQLTTNTKNDSGVVADTEVPVTSLDSTVPNAVPVLALRYAIGLLTDRINLEAPGNADILRGFVADLRKLDKSLNSAQWFESVTVNEWQKRAGAEKARADAAEEQVRELRDAEMRRS